MKLTRNDRDRTVVVKDWSLPTTERYDVVVGGGGVAGFCAALSAARTGAKTCLVEKSQVIGGTATWGLMNLFYTPYEGSAGIARELFDRLVREGAASPSDTIPFDPEMSKIEMIEMLVSAGVTLMLDTVIVETFVEKGELKGLIVNNKSGTQVVIGKRFIDATGDADICSMSDVPYTKGRDSDHKMRPMTLVFRVGGIDVEKLIAYVENHRDDFSKDPEKCTIDVENENIRIFGFFSLVEKAKAAGDLDDSFNYFRIESIFPSKGTGTVNTIRIYDVDGTNAMDLVKAQIMSRHQERALVNFMREYIPGCEAIYVLSSGQYVGIRDSRRIVGDFILTEQDILDKRHFDDVIGIGRSRQVPGPSGEGHDPGGHEGAETDSTVRRSIARLIEFEVPYRILLPQRIKNLLVAGKCVSSTHDANKYLRNQPVCMATGEAAGVACALSAAENLPLNGVDANRVRERIEIGQFVVD